MAFEELQERLKSEWQQTADRLSDNPLVLSLKDRYDNLSAPLQKLVVYGSIAGVALVLAMIPYNAFMTSSDTMSEFEGKRALMRDLIRTHRDAQSSASNIQPPMVNDVRSRVESIIGASQVLPEQNKGVTVISAQNSLIREGLVGGIVQVTLEQLNLKQVTALGTEFSAIQGAKLKDVLMDASNKDSRYFDVVFRILVFKPSTPAETPEEAPAGRGARGRGGQ